MLTRRYDIRFLVPLVIGLGSFLAISVRADERVISFYWQQAADTFRETMPTETALNYVATGVVLHSVLDSDGGIETTDTLIYNYYFRSGRLDSSVAVLGEFEYPERLDFSFPDIFQSDYELTLYPNDTGGGPLAIGFDNRSDTLAEPIGIVLLDRQHYTLGELLLNFNQRRGHRSYSQRFWFSQIDGLTMIDSLVIVGTIFNRIAPINYRLDVSLRGHRLWADADSSLAKP